ncbi:MAG TPA: hypothetical protein VFD45_03635 [Patescibacteria group bacterium]|nr:hypothetical protein [Patescibacteria group bacterium]
METSEVKQTVRSKIRARIKEGLGTKSKPKAIEFSSLVDFLNFSEGASDGIVAEATEKTILTELGFNKKRIVNIVTNFAVELRGVKDRENGKEEIVSRYSIPCGEIERDKYFSPPGPSDPIEINSKEQELRLRSFAVLDHKLRLVDEDRRKRVLYFGIELNDVSYRSLRETVKNLGISPVI